MAKGEFNAIKYISKHFKGFSQALVTVCIIYILLVLPKVAMPLLDQVFVDNIISGMNQNWTTAFFLISIFVVLFELAVRIMESNNWKIQLRMTINATTEMLWHTLHLPLSFFHDKYAGDIASRVSMASDVSQQMIRKMIPVLSEVILVVVYLFFMIKYNMVLSIFAIVQIVLNIVIMRKLNKKRSALNKEMQLENGKLQGFTTSSISNIEAIKGAGAEYGFFQRWANIFANAQNSAIRCSTKNIYLAGVPLVLESIASVLVLGIGAYYIVQGHLTIGMLMAFQGFLSGCMDSMRRLSDRFQTWANITAKCEIMDKVLSEESDCPEDIEDDKPIGEGKLRGYVELKDVTFGYDRNAGPLISNFNLTLEPGKSVAFVGQSGCGKSTLAKLISGLYQPWSGEILFDGQRQCDINRKLFNSSVAVVDQNIVLFDGSVADNIKLWDKSIEDFAMIFACHDAQIHNEIASRSKAYNTYVENGGKNFSGGQRQRLEIACALAKEPVIMVMDEGTSALDAVTEERVMNAIKDMGISLIIIAHRLSTIRDCDEIIVLDHGKVKERGNHEELMKNKGLYSQLVESN